MACLVLLAAAVPVVQLVAAVLTATGMATASGRGAVMGCSSRLAIRMLATVAVVVQMTSCSGGTAVAGRMLVLLRGR
jgi:hypothetical protein